MTEVRKFEQMIEDTFVEACVASHNDAVKAGQLDPENKFLAVANSIESAWPDVIERLRERLGVSKPPTP